MTPLYVLLIASVTWIFWVPAVLLEKVAKGDRGSTSIFPVLPVFPLAAWGIAYLIDFAKPQAGVVIVGGGHIIILASMLISITRSLLVIRHQKNC